MSLRSEFRQFVLRGNVIDLAIAVIIGAAFSGIITAFVEDLVMPIINPLIPGGDWRALELRGGFKVGHFAGVVLDFLIKATVIFLVLVKFLGFLKTWGQPAPLAAPQTKSCSECLELVPLAARRCRACTSVLAIVALLIFLPASASAQPDPKFQFEKPVEVKATELKASAKGGLLITGGNSQTTSGTMGGLVSYKTGWNRFSGDAQAAYVRAKALTVRLDPTDMNTTIDDGGELIRDPQTTSNLLQARGRYDRFLTENNSAYVSAQALRDRPAGKDIVAGGQVGYSRQVVKTARHTAVAEIGYDFSYEKSVGPTAEGVPIHSGRAFLAETLTLSDSTGITASVELLSNFNEERAPAPGYEAPDAFEDTRFVGKFGVTSALWNNLSFGFGFTAKYDAAPAPLPPVKVAGMTIPFAPTYRPYAEELDTILEATLILTFF